MEHLSLSAVPLLQDLLRTVQGSSWSEKALLTGTETENENKEEIEVEINMSAVVEKSRDCSDSTGSLSLTVFGGHDVTLFSMLFALNADVLTTNSVDKRNLYWPPFGSCKLNNDAVCLDHSSLNFYLLLIIKFLFRRITLYIHLIICFLP